MIFKMTKSIIFMFGCVSTIGYLWLTNQLNPVYLFLLGTLTALAFFYSTKEERTYDFDEIREKVFEKAKELQQKGQLPDGNITLMTETELKEHEIQSKKPEVIPDKWHVAVKIEGKSRDAFLFKVSVHGYVQSFSKIKQPTSFRVTDTPERTKISARPKRMEEDKSE